MGRNLCEKINFHGKICGGFRAVSGENGRPGRGAACQNRAEYGASGAGYGFSAGRRHE